MQMSGKKGGKKPSIFLLKNGIATDKKCLRGRRHFPLNGKSACWIKQTGKMLCSFLLLKSLFQGQFLWVQTDSHSTHWKIWWSSASLCQLQQRAAASTWGWWSGPQPAPVRFLCHLPGRTLCSFHQQWAMQPHRHHFPVSRAANQILQTLWLSAYLPTARVA